MKQYIGKNIGNYTSWIILIFGTLTHLLIWFYNRNLMIDEANLARNIYEKGFRDLALPLDYEQYAPPIYLCLVKSCSLLGGYGELPLRFISVVSIFFVFLLTIKIGKILLNNAVSWYPIAMIAVSIIMLRYGSELKQYMSDAAVALLLIYFALKWKYQDKTSFFINWIIIGSIAIWLSMPSVFILSAVGLYYIYSLWTADGLKPKVIRFLIIPTIWFIQFALYYFLLLKPQADTDYLQNFHNDYFLKWWPLNITTIENNVKLLYNLVKAISGYFIVFAVANTILLLLGYFHLWKHERARFFLFFTPVLLLIVAASLRQFTLIDRVVIFIYPIIILTIALGAKALIKNNRYFSNVALNIFLLLGVYTHSSVKKALTNEIRNEEVTDAYDFMMKNGITGENLYIDWGAMPAYKYYTKVHPDRDKYKTLENAHIVHYSTDYKDIKPPERFGINFSSASFESVKNNIEKVRSNYILEQYKENENFRTYAYIFK